MRKCSVLMILLFAFATILVAQEQPPPAPSQQPEKSIPQFSKPQLEQLVAPIALYPDDLLAQILAASTYPVDIIEAARWVKHNPSLDQDGINTELKSKKWDPSVKGVVFFPELLARMNDNMDWTKDLGDAFLTQQKDVMDTIQAMRKKAMDAGFLKSDANQKVTTNTEGQTEIQPTNPETVYVQNYVPSEAYGSDWDHHDDDDYWDYSGIVTAPAWPWRGRNVAAFALGYRCGWNNGGLGYNSNYYNGSFYKDNLKGKNIDPANREWVHDQANARSLSSNAQQAAGRLDNRTAQNFNKGDSANSKNLKQDLQDRDRTQAAKSALQNADRAQVANKAQNSDRVQSAKADLAASNKATPGGARTEAAKTAIQNADRAQVANKAQNSARVQNAKTAAQTQPRPTAKPAISGSSNANAERAYSNRGAQSRSSSAKTVKSHAGSAPKAKASKSGGGNRSGAARR